MNERRGGASRTDRGFSLIELIIAITIMGMAVGAVFGGLGLFFKVENTQASNARIDTEIRNYAERLLSVPVYKDCSTAKEYTDQVTKPAANFTPTVSIAYWDGKLPAGFGATCSADLGLQQITIVLSESNGVKGTLVIVKARS